MEQPTLRRLLERAMQPVGHTLYVWGGGWNAADTGAGREAVTLGVSPQWDVFFRSQGADYDVRKTRFQIHDGLDCSGFVGWVIYNVLQRENGKQGYVMPSGRMAQDFAARGWGTFTPAPAVQTHTAGDVMSTKGHVYLVVGACADGSVVLVHASPPGVQLSGTVTPCGEADSQAAALAEQYMRRYFPAFCAKFQVLVKDGAYLTQYDRMAWDVSGKAQLTDPDGFAALPAAQVLAHLFETGQTDKMCQGLS